MNARYSLLIALSLTACSVDEVDPIEALDAPLDDESDDSDEVAPASALAHGSAPMASLNACPGSPMIGVLQAGNHSCQLPGHLPPNSGWEGARMFATGSPGVDALTGPVPGELAKFCVFTPDDTSTDVSVLETAVDQSPHMNIASLAPDCRGIAGQGTGLADSALGMMLRQAFRTSVGRLSSADLAGTEVDRTPVDVAVVDTVSQVAADNPAVQPTNAHGLFMASLIDDIACPSGTTGCAATLRHTLAMPRNDWGNPSYLAGGVHGTKGDLALAIYEAVAEWQQDPDRAPRQVMNISLGGIRRLDVNNGQFDGKGPDQALRKALQYARCMGTLVVAAAGNAPVDGCPEDYTGPLSPASLEMSAAPTSLACDGMGFSSIAPPTRPIFGGPHSYDPLVHSVGGVDPFDHPLPNARTDARPRLAALGSDAVGSAGAHLDIGITGSSVSAAVVSATAAMLWTYDPSLAPPEVMELIYTSGFPLVDDDGFAIPADYGTGTTQADVRRVSVCAALEAACLSDPSLDCPSLDCPALSPAADGNLGGFFAGVDAVLADPSNDVIQVIPQDPGGSTFECIEGGSTNLHDPLPDLPVCARCNVSVDSSASTNDDTLKMTIESEYTGSTIIAGALLYVQDSNGDEREYDLGASVPSLNSEDDEVTTVSLELPSDPRSAMLVFDLQLPGEQESTRVEQVIPLEYED